MFEKFKKVAIAFKKELTVYRLVFLHPHTPWLAKVFLGIAIGYLLLPFDLIPDFIPLLGQLDDIVIVPLLIFLGLKLTPNALIEHCRQQVNN